MFEKISKVFMRDSRHAEFDDIGKFDSDNEDAPTKKVCQRPLSNRVVPMNQRGQNIQSTEKPHSTVEKSVTKKDAADKSQLSPRRETRRNPCPSKPSPIKPLAENDVIDPRFASARGTRFAEEPQETNQKEEASSDEKEDDTENVASVFSKVRHNRTSEVRQALAAGFKATATDANGNNLLHICAQNNLKKLAAIVISAGCPVNRRNLKGLTPLDYCKNYKFLQFEEWLMENHDVSIGGGSMRSNTSTQSNKRKVGLR